MGTFEFYVNSWTLRKTSCQNQRRTKTIHDSQPIWTNWDRQGLRLEHSWSMCSLFFNMDGHPRNTKQSVHRRRLAFGFRILYLGPWLWLEGICIRTRGQHFVNVHCVLSKVPRTRLWHFCPPMTTYKNFGEQKIGERLCFPTCNTSRLGLSFNTENIASLVSISFSLHALTCRTWFVLSRWTIFQWMALQSVSWLCWVNARL